MSVTRTGSIIEIDSASNSGSQSITVPSDAEYMVCSASGYLSSGGSNFMNANPPTIASNAMTLVRDDDNDGTRLIQCLFRYVSPPTGTQTFAWDWAGTTSATLGIQMQIAFYKGVNTTTPEGANAGSADADASATTGSMTVTNGDAVFVAAVAYNAVLPTIDFTNCTEIADNSALGLQAGCAEAFPSTDTTFTATHNGGSGGIPATTISAIVIKQAAGTASILKQMMAHEGA